MPGASHISGISRAMLSYILGRVLQSTLVILGSSSWSSSS